MAALGIRRRRVRAGSVSVCRGFVGLSLLPVPAGAGVGAGGAVSAVSGFVGRGALVLRYLQTHVSGAIVRENIMRDVNI